MRLAAQEGGPYASLDLSEAAPESPLEQLSTVGGAELTFQHA
ncbi:MULTISPECIES: hypothetical protein [unclassified Caballeronia]|nr:MULTISPECIES: hypothetical protein [unclassified Caballeronia]